MLLDDPRDHELLGLAEETRRVAESIDEPGIQARLEVMASELSELAGSLPSEPATLRDCAAVLTGR